MSELPEKDISNVMVSVDTVAFYNKLSWFESKLLEKHLKKQQLQLTKETNAIVQYPL